LFFQDNFIHWNYGNREFLKWGEDMEKKRIAVFDYNASDCVHTADAVREFYREQDAEAEVVEFMASVPFANDFKYNLDAGTPYNMAFIGVDNMRGLEMARNIRELDSCLPMFFVSKGADFSLEGFRLHALDYLTRPVTPLRIGEAVRRIGGSGWP